MTDQAPQNAGPDTGPGVERSQEAPASARLTVTKSRLLTAAACAAAPVVGVLGEVLWDCFDETDPDLFVIAAQVGPVFGLAVFVEITIVMGRALAQKKSRKKQATTRALARTVVRTNAGLLLVSEGAALYAVGANVSSTFLLTSVLGPWLLQIYLLVDTAYHRIGVSKLGRGA